MRDTKMIKCPFCGEDDFDKIGLKIHLVLYCETYANTPMQDPKDDDGMKDERLLLNAEEE